MSKLKYGIVDSSQKPAIVRTMGLMTASTVLPAKSGRFVTYNDTANTWEALGTGDAKIGGYVEQHLTCGAATVLPIVDVRGLTFEVPYATGDSVTTQLTAAVLADLIGKTCDIHVASNIQYADVADTTDNLFLIVGGDTKEGYGTVYVQVVESKIGYVAS